MQELERAKVVEAYAKGEIKAAVAALRLQVSTRQVRRLAQRLAKAGVAGMMSRRRGKASNNQLVPGLAEKALQLVREHYGDFGPTLACEMLGERHGLVLSKETLRRLMIEAGLWAPRSARRAALHQPRERRNCLGELVQVDGSRHPWFEQRGPECTVLAYIDDATGRILHLQFAETETTFSYFEATRCYIARYGKPRAFYADRAAVFRSAAAKRHVPTQFQRALDELGIDLICANSPQAKGRVERLNRTLQDRLVKALRMEGIDDIEAANAWCGQFVEKYNRRFARAPRSQLDVHVPPSASEDLSLILALRDTRKLSAKLTVQHAGRQYLLEDLPELRALIGQPVEVHTFADGSVQLRVNGKHWPYTALEMPRPAGPIEVDNKTLHHTVDQLDTSRRPRNRPHRQNQPASVVARGVTAAKKMSAQRVARAPGG